MIKQVNDSTESNGIQPYQQNRVYDPLGESPALVSQMSGGAHAIGLDLKTISGKSKTRRGGITAESIGTIDGNGLVGVATNYRIRRLTEIECERLQGFPDGHTAFGDYEGVVKPVSKTQRYKMMGNAVTRKIVKQIVIKLLA